MKHILAVTVLGLLFASGCATISDEVAPTAFTSNDGNGVKWMARQPPVSSSSNLSEGQHGLGFTWFAGQKFVSIEPVVFTLGSGQISRFISEVSFDADGSIITALKEQDTKGEGKNLFRISMDDFMKIATAQNVQMKLTRTGIQTTSTFGAELRGTRAVVNERFPAFIEMIQDIQNDRKGM